ncbi:hypothetical protein BH20ACI2_BH20ACI2_08570 [soil metagenome]
MSWMRNDLWKNKSAAVDTGLGAFIFLFILLVPIFSPHQPNTQEPTKKLRVMTS